MIRTLIIGPAIVAIVAIAITVWLHTQSGAPPVPVGDNTAALQQFDTTGGQEMRPRWESVGEQRNDAAGN